MYLSDELGGRPLVYARKATDDPFKSYQEFLDFYGEEALQRSYEQLGHRYDFINKIQVDGSPESYFDLSVLALQADQFYLWWHGLYNDLQILCDSSDVRFIEEDLSSMFDLELPQEIKDRLNEVDFSPSIQVQDRAITLRFVTFSKWSGLYEYVYVIDRKDPDRLLHTEFNPIIEYGCGVSF